MTESTNPHGTAAHDNEPVNNAPSLKTLRESFITPEAHFFNRNHGDIPSVDPETFRLQVTGAVETPLSLSLQQLRADFPKQTVLATMTCAGNRRTELHAISPIVNEIIWDNSAISNAEWGGVLLRDVLAQAGLTASSGMHIVFEGMDQIEKDDADFFGASIDIDKALNADVLLAYEMNGEPLTPIRGFPIRVMVPGYIGARSVKWLRTIIVQSAPSPNYYQQKAYKMFAPDVSAETADWAAAPMLTDQALNALICTPEPETTLSGNTFQVSGFALPQGDHTITRVELSSDAGHTWTEVSLTTPAHKHTWCFWAHELTLVPGRYELVVRAYDSGGHTQPPHAAEVWNFKGYMNNAWHRVVVQVE
ncbi:MAG: sulfite oxidase [Anaerolineae bacterium]